MSIVLHIERLVLDEAVLGGERAHKVRAELEHELVRELSTAGIAQALSGIGSVASLPPLALSHARSPRGDVGGRIAAAVSQGLGAGSAAQGAGSTAMKRRHHG